MLVQRSSPLMLVPAGVVLGHGAACLIGALVGSSTPMWHSSLIGPPAMPVGSPVARWTGTGTRRRFASREGHARSPRTSAVPDRPVRLHGAAGAFGSTEGRKSTRLNSSH